MSTAGYIMIALFAAYVGYIWRRFGVLSSISASSYELRGNERYLFTGWLVSLALLCYGLDLGLFAHLMAVGFAVAGMSLDHKKSARLEDEFHFAGSVLAIGSGFLGLYLLHGVWIPMMAFVGGAIALMLWARHWIWWTELLAMGLITSGLLMR